VKSQTLKTIIELLKIGSSIFSLQHKNWENWKKFFLNFSEKYHLRKIRHYVHHCSNSKNIVQIQKFWVYYPTVDFTDKKTIYVNNIVKPTHLLLPTEFQYEFSILKNKFKYKNEIIPQDDD